MFNASSLEPIFTCVHYSELPGLLHSDFKIKLRAEAMAICISMVRMAALGFTSACYKRIATHAHGSYASANPQDLACACPMVSLVQAML